MFKTRNRFSRLRVLKISLKEKANLIIGYVRMG